MSTPAPDPQRLGGFGLGASGEASRPLRAGTRLGDYELLEEIARGGMGVVFRARHTKLERVVAVKVLTHGSTSSPRQLERFRRESRAAARLQHPNIVTVHDAGHYSGEPYLVMDFVAGESLEQRLAKGGPFEPRVAAIVGEQIARALEHAHEQALLHRDVKPANVILATDGTPKLTDFGLAKDLLRTSEMTQSGQLLGTPAFMSPEQAEGQGAYVDARADVYSLGATLFALLTGEPPFAGETQIELLGQVLSQEPTAPSRGRPEVPVDLDTICLKCLEKDPGDRYASAREVADELARVARGEPILTRPPELRARVRRAVRRQRKLVALVGLVVGLLIGGGLVASHQEQRRQVAEAAQRSRAAWAEVGAEAQDPLASALAALQAAQHYHVVSGGEAEAEGALLEAAGHLGDVALETQQWGLAVQAYRTAAEHGGDPARADRALEASQAEARRKLAAVAQRLDEVRTGAARARPGGLWEASFAIARDLDPTTLRRLCQELERLSAKLEAERRALLLEAAGEAGSPGRPGGGGDLSRHALDAALSREQAGAASAADRALIEGAQRQVTARLRRTGSRDGHPRPSYLEALAERQALALGGAGEALLVVLCRVLGNSGEAAAVPPLTRYLQVEADAARAARAGIALCLLGEEEAARAAGAQRSEGAMLYFSALRPYLDPRAGQGSLEPSGAGLRREDLLAQAREAQLQLRHAQARAVFQELVDRDPRDVEARLGVARSAYQLDDPGAALEALEGVQVTTDSVAAEVESLRGACHEALGQREQALRCFERALQRNPDLASAHVGRVKSLVEASRVAEARAAFDRAQAAGVTQLDIAEAYLLYREGKFTAARAAAEARLQQNPRDVDALQLLATVHMGFKDGRRALEAVERALEVASGEPALWALRGAIYTDLLGQPRRGVEDLRKALELGGARYEYLLQLGNCQLKAGEAQAAVEAYQRALKQDRTRSEAYIGLSNGLQQLGEAAREREVLRACVERFPELSAGWVNLGRNLLHGGRYAEGERATRKALALQTSFAARANLAILVSRQGRSRESLALFDAAFELAPPGAEGTLLLQRAKSFLELGDLPACRSDLEAIPREERSALARGCLGRVQVLEGDALQGLAGLDAALGAGSKQLDLLLWRGQSLCETGDAVAGQADLRRFLKFASPEDGRRAAAEELLRAE